MKNDIDLCKNDLLHCEIITLSICRLFSYLIKYDILNLIFNCFFTDLQPHEQK
jgi:hypothetical protein